MSDRAPGIQLFQSVTATEKSPFDVNKLADRFRYRATDWSIPEAYLALLLSAAVADGGFDAVERDTVMMLARRARALSGMSSADLASANNTVAERLNSRPEALREACETLPRDMVLSVFAHCVDIVLADGDLVRAEAEFLQQLATLLEIESDQANKIVEVLLIKAKY